MRISFISKVTYRSPQSYDSRGRYKFMLHHFGCVSWVSWSTGLKFPILTDNEIRPGNWASLVTGLMTIDFHNDYLVLISQVAKSHPNWRIWWILLSVWFGNVLPLTNRRVFHLIPPFWDIRALENQSDEHQNISLHWTFHFNFFLFNAKHSALCIAQLPHKSSRGHHRQCRWVYKLINYN